MFNYSQAILRKLNLIFDKRNDSNEDLHKLVKTAALPLVPIENVDVWEQTKVVEQTDRNDLSVIEFLDYVTDT